MKIIKLNKGYEVLVDDEDYDQLSKYTWYVQFSSNNAYARRSEYIHEYKIRIVFMHVQIMGYKGVDHKDNNGLNNQKSNLRAATNRQNQQNMAGIWGRVPFKGVFYLRGRKKYVARINVNGQLKQVGSFCEAKNAAKAYDKAALKYFGEFAKTNEMLGLFNVPTK